MDEFNKLIDVQHVRIETRQKEYKARLQTCVRELEKMRKLQRKYKGAYDTLLELETSWKSKTRMVINQV